MLAQREIRGVVLLVAPLPLVARKTSSRPPLPRGRCIISNRYPLSLPTPHCLPYAPTQTHYKRMTSYFRHTRPKTGRCRGRRTTEQVNVNTRLPLQGDCTSHHNILTHSLAHSSVSYSLSLSNSYTSTVVQPHEILTHREHHLNRRPRSSTASFLLKNQNNNTTAPLAALDLPIVVTTPAPPPLLCNHMSHALASLSTVAIISILSQKKMHSFWLQFRWYMSRLWKIPQIGLVYRVL